MAPRKSNRTPPTNNDTHNQNNDTPNQTDAIDARLEQLVAQRVSEALAAANNRVSSTNIGDGTSRPANGNRSCTYKEFRACSPGSFGGTEGVVSLTQWLERLETIFRICNCEEESKVKYASYTLTVSALTWWNSYMKSAGMDIAYAMAWEQFKALLLQKYCPRTEVKKMEVEFWNLKVQGTNITTYTHRFQELALLCPELVSTEARMIERYIGGLPLSIRGSVIASKPADLHATISLSNSLMDQVIQDMADKGGDSKRKWEDNSRVNHQPNKRQEVAKVYSAGPSDQKVYAGKLPFCNRCKLHHNGPCTVKCRNCQKIGHMARDCRSPTIATAQGAPAFNQRAPIIKDKSSITCFGCGEKGHYKSECRKQKNHGNNGNQAAGGNQGNAGGARGRVYVVGGREAPEDPNVVTGVN